MADWRVRQLRHFVWIPEWLEVNIADEKRANLLLARSFGVRLVNGGVRRDGWSRLGHHSVCKKSEATGEKEPRPSQVQCDQVLQFFNSLVHIAAFQHRPALLVAYPAQGRIRNSQ